ncbi:Ff.00g116360.m01.CDS01 [Fusarium sp. VM40]|nr:Ff.00g116360.m01.CDS01 [Fusarium sp. VM40]
MPKDGLEAKFSVYHSGACGILFGRTIALEYEDNVVLDPAVIAIRDRITAKIDTSIASDSVKVRVTFENGEVLTNYVKHAIGSRGNPLSDTKLQKKFTEGCKSVGMRDAEAVSEFYRGLEAVDEMRQLIKYL